MTRFAALAGSRRRVKSLPVYVTSLRSRSLAANTNVVGALTGVAVGDILIAYAAGSTQTSSLTTPTGVGWALVPGGDTDLLFPGSDAARLRVYTTVATSANQTGGTWTWTGTNGDHWVGIVAYRNAVLPTVAVMNKVAAARSIVAPSVTTTADNAVVLTAGFYTNAGAALSWTGSMTQRLTNGGNSTSTDGQIMEDNRLTAGATGTRTFTTSTTGTIATATSTASVILDAA